MTNQHLILWRKMPGGGAEVLRVYGSRACVVLPEELEGCKVEKLSPYCFSSARHIPEGKKILTLAGAYGPQKQTGACEADMKELCGNLVEEVTLPDTLLELGECTFYNCKKLSRVEAGARLEQIGSDAFMNTLDFHQLVLRCGPGEKTGLKRMLSQIASDMEVVFRGKNGIEAVLFYPEYFESYDEVAPAHLFGRSITGEGFRARQCFTDGAVEFLGYDKIFPRACVEESEGTLCRIALNRLMYPSDLTEENEKTYQDYLSEHASGLAKQSVEERNLKVLEFLCKRRLLASDNLTDVISYAAARGWAEGTAALMSQSAAWRKEKRGNRYEFD